MLASVDMTTLSDFAKVSEWYEKQTGQSAARAQARVLKVLEYLERYKLQLRQVRLENHTDENWNKRRDRSEAEQRAECIGFSNEKEGKTRWWIVPKS